MFENICFYSFRWACVHTKTYRKQNKPIHKQYLTARSSYLLEKSPFYVEGG